MGAGMRRVHGWRRGVFAAAAAALAICAGQGFARAGASAPSASLTVYFIDVEGGAATLVVSPAGESLLIDSGFPGERDAGRIARVAREQAGLERIDHYVTTHWHRDHVGGIGDLTRLMPVTRYYGHPLPDPLPSDVPEPLVDAWRRAAANAAPTWLKAGDRIPLRSAAGAPPLRVDVLAADGQVLGEAAGSPQVRHCDRGHAPKDPDTTDNARSLGFLVSYGAFDLFAGGDLTWNVEHKLVCPSPVFAVPVDAYLVNHHGADSSNNPALVHSLRPTVAIVNSGPRKGAEPRTMQLLLEQVGAGRVFQLHRNVREGAVNADPPFVANDHEACDAAFVRLTVSPDATRYTVGIPAKNGTWTYDVK